jgi:hypothetical protein
MKRAIICIITSLLVFQFAYNQDNNNSAEPEFNFNKMNRAQAGVLYSVVNSDNGTESIPGLVVSNSYLIKPGSYWAYGVGSGFELYKEQLFIPVYANILVNLHKNIALDFQSGYSLGWKRKSEYYENHVFKGGIIFNIGLQYNVKLHSNFESFIEASYNFQKANLTSSTLPASTLRFNSVMLTLGIIIE